MVWSELFVNSCIYFKSDQYNVNIYVHVRKHNRRKCVITICLSIHAPAHTLTLFHTRVKGEHLAAKRLADFIVKTPVVVDAVTSEQHSTSQCKIKAYVLRKYSDVHVDIKLMYE